MSDTPLKVFKDGPPLQVSLRASEIALLVWLLEKASSWIRTNHDGMGTSGHCAIDLLRTKLTDLEGTTEERFDEAVARIIR